MEQWKRKETFMGKQIYICWEEGQAEELFQYVQEECGMTILPMKKMNSTSTNADAIPCVFVQEEAAGLFRYKRFRDENGELCKVLYPFDRNKDNLPYIEYTQEYSNNKAIGRLWCPTYLIKSELVEKTKQSFKLIEQWANQTCMRKEGIFYVL